MDIFTIRGSGIPETPNWVVHQTHPWLSTHRLNDAKIAGCQTQIANSQGVGTVTCELNIYILVYWWCYIMLYL